LGKIKRNEDIALFIEKCKDNNSKVRTVAIRILGDYGEPELIAFFRKQFNVDDSYLAQAEALRSIGKCGDKSQLSFLENAVKMKSPRDIIKKAARQAIKEIERKEES